MMKEKKHYTGSGNVGKVCSRTIEPPHVPRTWSSEPGEAAAQTIPRSREPMPIRLLAQRCAISAQHPRPGGLGYAHRLGGRVGGLQPAEVAPTAATRMHGRNPGYIAPPFRGCTEEPLMKVSHHNGLIFFWLTSHFYQAKNQGLYHVGIGAGHGQDGEGLEQRVVGCWLLCPRVAMRCAG